MKKYIYSERVNLFEPNVYIHFLVQITGAPSPEDLVLAVKTAFSMNESYMNRLNRKWRRSGRSFTWNDYYEIHETYWKQRSSRIVYEKFSSEETNKILLCSKEMEVSVNSYIATERAM